MVFWMVYHAEYHWRRSWRASYKYHSEYNWTIQNTIQSSTIQIPLHIIPSNIQNTIDKYHSKDKLINIFPASQRSYAHIDQTENMVKIN